MNHSFHNPDEFSRWNEEMSRKYNPDLYHSNPSWLIRYIEYTRTRAALRALSLGTHGALLDVGCGAGNMLEVVRREYPSLPCTGVDLSHFMVELARKRFAADRQVEIFEGDVETLESVCAGRTFTHVLMSEVLEHVQHPRRVLESIRSIIVDDGVFVCSLPNDRLIERIKKILIRTGLLQRLFPHLSQDVEMEWHVHDIRPKTFAALAKDFFEVRRVIAVPFRVLPIRYVIQCAPIKPARQE